MAAATAPVDGREPAAIPSGVVRSAHRIALNPRRIRLPAAGRSAAVPERALATTNVVVTAARNAPVNDVLQSADPVVTAAGAAIVMPALVVRTAVSARSTGVGAMVE